MVEVRWRFRHADGTPVSGAVLVTPTVEVVNGGWTYTRATVRVPLDTTGLMKVDLLANDDPGNDRTDGEYQFAPRLESGRNPAPVTMTVPVSATATGIDLPTGDAGPGGPGDVVATQVFADTFDTYATGNLPNTPWTLHPDTGIWRADATTDVAWANGSPCNAVRDTGARDHRVLAHVKTSVTPCVAGVVLRYKDQQNYISFEYVFTTTEPHAWSFFILANNVGREVKLPASAPFVVDQDHTLQVDAFGDVITVTENGVPWGDPITLTSTENTALGTTATWAGMINFSGRGNFYDVTGYTLTTS